MTRARPVELVWAQGATAVAASTFAGVFVPVRLVVPVAVAIAVPSAIALGIRRVVRRPTGVAILVSQALALALSWTVLFGRSVSSWSGVPGAFWSALRDGWAEVLSTTLPALADRNTLTVPMVSTWVVAAIVAETVIRSKHALAVLSPVVILSLVGTLFSDNGAPPYWGWGAFMLALGGGLLVVRARATSHRHDLAGVGLVVVTIALTLPLAASSAFRGANAHVLRHHWAPETSAVSSASPFAEVARVRDDPTASGTVVADVVLDSTAFGPPSVPSARPALRLSTLDGFDGLRWSSSGQYTALGERLPQTEVAPNTGEVTASVAFRPSNPFPFVPTPGEALSLTNSSLPEHLAVNRRDGSLAPRSGRPLRSGTVRITASVPTASEAVLRRTSSARSWPGRSMISTTGDLTRAVPAGGTTPYERVTAIEAFLTNRSPSANPTRFAIDPTIRGPFTTGRLRSFLGLDGLGPAVHVGPPEEFAVAFALLARDRGIAVRLGYGFVLPAGTVRGRRVAVTEAMLAVWPEVHFDDVGWMRYDPASELLAADPSSSAAPPKATPQTTPPPDESTHPVPATVPASSPRRRPSSPPATAKVVRHQRGRGSGSVPPVSMIVGISIVLTLLVAVAPTLWRRRRRARRRHRGRVAEQVAGAWNELSDELVRRRVRDAARLTTGETIEAVGRTMGAAAKQEAAQLAVVIDTGLFAPDEPTPEQATQAWELLAKVEGAATPRRRTRQLSEV